MFRWRSMAQVGAASASGSVDATHASGGVGPGRFPALEQLSVRLPSPAGSFRPAQRAAFTGRTADLLRALAHGPVSAAAQRQPATVWQFRQLLQPYLPSGLRGGPKALSPQERILDSATPALETVTVHTDGWFAWRRTACPAAAIWPAS